MDVRHQSFAEALESFSYLTEVDIRVDDNKHGGDIDLYVSPDKRDHLAEERIAFLVRLKRRIGEQNIDLVIASKNPRHIDVIAQQQGVVLCRKH